MKCFGMAIILAMGMATSFTSFAKANDNLEQRLTEDGIFADAIQRAKIAYACKASLGEKTYKAARRDIDSYLEMAGAAPDSIKKVSRRTDKTFANDKELNRNPSSVAKNCVKDYRYWSLKLKEDIAEFKANE